MKKISYLVLLVSLLSFSPLKASDGYGYYVGVEAGFVGATFGNALGGGIALGARTNSMMDVLFISQYSTHNGGTKLYPQALEANFHVWQGNDLDFSMGGGPGFYVFSGGGASTTEFGLHFSSALDVMATDQLRLGVGYRYHGIFGTNQPDYSTVMMRVGFILGDE